MVYEWPFSQEQYEYLKSQDALFLEALAQKNYSKAGNLSQQTLKFFISDVMEFTNLYDFTFNDNSLTNYEYVCYLQQPEVRRAIHTGNEHSITEICPTNI